MTHSTSRRATPWRLLLAALFLLANVAFAIWAARAHEVAHTAVHVVLALLAAFAVRWLSRRRRAQPQDAHAAGVAADPAADASARLGSLADSVDVVALEIARIGERQRHLTDLLTERPPRPEIGASAAPGAPRAHTAAHETAHEAARDGRPA